MTRPPVHPDTVPGDPLDSWGGFRDGSATVPGGLVRLPRRPLPTGAGRGAIRLTAVLLWLLVGTGAVSGVAALVRTGGPSTPAAVPAGVEGFAELCVATYLERGGEPGALDAFGAGVVGGAIPATPRFVARAAAVDVVPKDPDRWSVTVGAEVLVGTHGGYRRDALRSYRVEIRRVAGRYEAVSAPEEIAGLGG